MTDKDLKLETKCYDAMEYGYLYGLNKKIPDEEWEKVKPYMRKWKRMDFVEGNIKVTGRPEGYRKDTDAWKRMFLKLKRYLE